MPVHLDDYLTLDYPLALIPDPDGGYVFDYPDLPGCRGQIENLAELADHADEARRLWLEVAIERGLDIALPTYPREYSGTFVVRLSKALHRRLAETAAREGISLNHHVASLLSEQNAYSRVSEQLAELSTQVNADHEHQPVAFAGAPIP